MGRSESAGLALETGDRTYVIAEIGVNHDGNVGKALELVDAVAQAGADAVKLQTFAAETLVSAQAPKAAYQLITTPTEESQFEMLRRLELSRDDHWAVLEAARRAGLEFLSTPYDLDSLAFLVHELAVDRVKIASSDITNLPLLLAAGQSRRKVILSTGMSTVEEITQALSTLALGGTTDVAGPSWDLITSPPSRDGHSYLREHVVLLQCTSQYPAPVEEANLQAIVTLRDLFGVPVGYSDHTLGTVTALLSVAYGSVVYERHFTLDRKAPGPDHSASIEPDEFAALVRMIREAELARGTGVKEPSPSESSNRHPMRKGLIARRAIKAGHVIGVEDVAFMRPVDGDTPAQYWTWLGRTADRDYATGEPLRSTDDA